MSSNTAEPAGAPRRRGRGRAPARATSATTARVGVDLGAVGASARRPPGRRGRRPCVTGASQQRTSPPRDSSRRTSAAIRLPAPPSGTGKPTDWARHAQHPAEEAADGRLRREVGVQRVAGDAAGGPPRRRTPPRPCAGPAAMAKRAKRSSSRRLERADELQRPLDRRERAEQRGDDAVLDPLPQLEQPAPRVAVAGRDAVRACRR